MNIARFNKFWSVAFALSFSILGANAASTNELPKLDDLLKLLREHGALSQAELDRAATEGVLSSLHGQVLLVTNDAKANAAKDQPALSRSTNFDSGFAYFRIAEVKGDLSQQIEKAYGRMAASGKIKGVVLDLRFAGGSDYAAAAHIADLFMTEKEPLLSWKDQTVESTQKTNAINVPVAVIVNKQTGGAAEALAAILRETHVALLIGASTEGSSSVFNEFALPNGQRVRVAVSQVKVAGDKVVPVGGLKPDIEVAVSADDEKAYFQDPYKNLAKTETESAATNSVASISKNQPRLNEAELVRQHKEGINIRDELSDQPLRGVESIHTINDPALMRALDLLKGLSVVQQTRH